MNLFKQLFSHHPQEEHTSAAVVKWVGQSEKQYSYVVYPVEASFRPLPGNYIYARQTEEGWVPIYIAQTRDLHQRLEGHVKVEDAIQNGATHIHAHYDSAGQSSRCDEERDLVLHWQPVCNDSAES